MTVTSAAMRALRRKLQTSRIAPAGGIAKMRPESVSTGTKVRVRTSAGQLCTGQRLVLVLNAVVVSATENGYVVYNGNPLKTLNVAKDEVKVI
jgi:hypothetical protein